MDLTEINNVQKYFYILSSRFLLSHIGFSLSNETLPIRRVLSSQRNEAKKKKLYSFSGLLNIQTISPQSSCLIMHFIENFL